MIDSWLKSAKLSNKNTAQQKNETGLVYVYGKKDTQKTALLISSHAADWQKKQLIDSNKETLHWSGRSAPVWIISAKAKPTAVSHQGMLEDSDYSYFREQVGTVALQIKAFSLKSVQFHFEEMNQEQLRGALVALDLARYNYADLQIKNKKTEWPQLNLIFADAKMAARLVEEARVEAQSINLARHLVNLPPNLLNPKTFIDYLKPYKKLKGLKIELWNEKKLKSEKMNLHLAVGSGALHAPCLLHLKYRPAGTKKQKKSVALVGKGITFDSGGLDIKPSSGMRLMKKDMGGAATVASVLIWAAQSKYPYPLDGYLALAENAVDAKSFRPSDVIQARNGSWIEIDNTDAEGRLVLADAIDVALTRQEGKPETLIDVATLTGAIKVALGSEISGLFCNHDELADELLRAGQQTGDLSWRMPMAEKYWASMSSNFADFKNSADGFGGAITAALFLSRFVKSTPWAHFDIYAWSDKNNGPITAGGGSGQAVQCLIGWLKNR